MTKSASECLLDRFAAVLADPAVRHGLSNLGHGGPGTVFAASRHTLCDLARFELEAESLLGKEVFVISSDAPAAPSMSGHPLQIASAS